MLAAPSSSRPRFRLLAAAGLAAALAAFAVPGVRDAAAELLTIFRAKRVQPVTVAPITAPLPFEKGSKLDLGTITKEQQGQAREVDSAQEAATVAGFALRLPQKLPASASGAPAYGVFEGAAVSFTVDAAKVRAALAQAGISDVPLDPKLDGSTLRLSVPPYAMTRWGDNLLLAQGRSPEVTGTAGLDYDQLRGQFLDVMARFSPEMALQLRNLGDWRTTLPIPIPPTASQREVQVDGVTGALIEGVEQGKKGAAVLWQKDGLLYVLATEGEGVPSAALLDAANSLK